MPKIAIIVPVYKAEFYLQRCMESIFAQTFSDFEVILVDDGSPDNSGAICDEYAKKDVRVHVIHQENQGQAAARNAALDWLFANSDSEWITFVDSDDWVHPQYLEVLLSAAQKHAAEISVCSIQRVTEKIECRKVSFDSRTLSSAQLYLHYTKNTVNVSLSAKLYARRLFENLRLPVGKIWEDLATTYKLILPVSFCAVIDVPLYYYFSNPEGTIQKSWTPQRLDEFEAYETQLEFFSKEEKWNEIYTSLQETYIRQISYSYFKERESDLPAEEKAYYAALLSRKMRRALQQHKKTTGKALPFAENKSIYETAFPRLMGVYWTMKGIAGKFKS